MRTMLALVLSAALCAGAWADEEAAPAPDAPEETSVEPETKRVLGVQIPATWDGRLELGYSAARGNTHTDDLRLAARAMEESETNRTSLDLTFDWGSTRGDSTKHQLSAGILQDFLFPGRKYFLFVEGRYDWDRFKDWDHRFSGRAGVGYDFYRTDILRLTGRAGVGATEGVNDGKSWDLDGSLGAEGRWRPRKGLEFGAKSTYYAALNNDRFADPWRTVSEAYCQLQMATYEQVSIRFGIEHEYRSRVGANIKKNDTRWTTTVVYSF